MKRSKVIGTFCLALVLFSSVSAGPFQNWRFLGSRNVSDRLDHDSIPVTRLKGDLRRVEITYANGSKQKVQMRSLIRAGGETRAIDLRGRQRVIRKIEFWYEAKSLGRRSARVSLYGLD